MFITHSSEHNLVFVLIVHHSAINVTRRPSDLSSWSQRHLHTPKVAHLDLIRTPLGPHFLLQQAVRASLLAKFLLAKRNAHFRYPEPLFKTHSAEHNLVLVLIVHHSVVKVTRRPSDLSVDAPAIRAHTYKNQQHTYRCEQTCAQRLNDRQARIAATIKKREHVHLCLTK